MNIEWGHFFSLHNLVNCQPVNNIGSMNAMLHWYLFGLNYIERKSKNEESVRTDKTIIITFIRQTHKTCLHVYLLLFGMDYAFPSGFDSDSYAFFAYNLQREMKTWLIQFQNPDSSSLAFNEIFFFQNITRIDTEKVWFLSSSKWEKIYYEMNVHNFECTKKAYSWMFSSIDSPVPTP